MAEAFVGEIRIFAGNFAPKGWALCNGQLLPISQNTALFALLGTYYGGDGKSTFALPDLQGRAPMQAGQGPGLSIYDLGQSGGETAVTLTSAEMPSHAHQAFGAARVGNQGPTNGVWAMPGARGVSAYNVSPGTSPAMSPGALPPTGGSQPHNNMPPYLTLTFIIALQGIYPQRS